MSTENKNNNVRQASLDNVLFNVEQIPMSEATEIFPNLNFGNQYSSVIYCPSMSKVLHLSGSKYQLITNEQLITPIYDKLVSMFGPNGFTITCSNHDDRRFWFRFILNEHEIKVTNNDFLNVMIVVQNSYDGSMQHGFGISYLRQICTNGLMGWTRDSMVSQKHDTESIEANVKTIMGRLDDIDVQLQQFRKLTERRITGLEMEQIMEKIRELKFHDAFPKKLIPEVSLKVYQEAETLSSEPNAWLLYNGFNYFLNHDERIGAGLDIVERIDRNVLKIIHKELALN